MKEKTNYGNWVPEKMLYLMFGLAAVFLVITVAAKAVLHKPVIAIVLGALCILSLLYAVYMLICHEIFAFGKGNMMAGVHEHLVDHLCPHRDRCQDHFPQKVQRSCFSLFHCLCDQFITCSHIISCSKKHCDPDHQTSCHTDTKIRVLQIFSINPGYCL